MRFIFDDGSFEYERSVKCADKEYVNTFILTRFNVPLAGAREKGGFEDENRFKVWCRNRSNIFINRCLPSIIKQYTKPDFWIILFDVNYHDEVMPALEAIKRYDWIKAIFVGSDYEGLRQEYNKVISELIDTSKQYTATIRLDNDDALSRGYCLAVDQYLKGVDLEAYPDEFWISFPFGVQWDDQDATLLIQNNNPFLTFIEPTKRFIERKAKTAMSINHGHIFDHGAVFLPTPRFPMWLQYVHGENVSNSKNNMLFRFNDVEDVLSRFGLKG